MKATLIAVCVFGMLFAMLSPIVSEAKGLRQVNQHVAK
jgi:hypothetical protein